ncbi:hypothetical protein ACPUER_00260 [Burkholderia sp. DN3021]|uniref:hypothetical protein n=1 Tax=Burkholderia sp. DN3021 TaxID=3410137 RepID=UPI003C7A1CB3
MKTIEKARLAISRITSREKVSLVRQEIAADDDDWFRISAKAYSLHLQIARKKRKEDAKERNIGITSNEEIGEILKLNDRLCIYAVCLPTLATKSDVTTASLLLSQMPQSENQLLLLIEGMTLEPRVRALQNIGRIRHYSVFKEFSNLVEAATLCYYRGNFASAYLTLVPVIEGIILRWSGYQGNGDKPEFEEIRKFFGASHVRQPCPGNPLFHDVFCRACDRIINDHLYQPSRRGTAYAEFNRHQAAHLLRDTTFATRENCIRLFLLLDTMTEVYLYETYCRDPRWELEDVDIRREVMLYKALQLKTAVSNTPENILLRGGALVG